MFGLQDSHLGLPELAYLIISLRVAPFLKPLALPSPAPITLFPFTFLHTRFTENTDLLKTQKTISVFLSTKIKFTQENLDFYN